MLYLAVEKHKLRRRARSELKCHIHSVLGIFHRAILTNWLFAASVRNYASLSQKATRIEWPSDTYQPIT